MSVNFGAGVAAAPNQPNVDGAPPPQQPLAPAHHPSVTTVAAAVSPLNAPPVDDSSLASSNPTLTSRASFAAAMNKLSADWAKREKSDSRRRPPTGTSNARSRFTTLRYSRG